MAERKNQPSFRCQFQYQFDRHASEKMAQAYRWLAPTDPPENEHAHDQLKTHEKDRRHLRTSLV